MDEMKSVVKEAMPLGGKALRRAKAVEAAFGRGDGLSEEAVRAEFQGLLAVS